MIVETLILSQSYWSKKVRKTDKICIIKGVNKCRITRHHAVELLSTSQITRLNEDFHTRIAIQPIASHDSHSAELHRRIETIHKYLTMHLVNRTNCKRIWAIQHDNTEALLIGCEFGTHQIPVSSLKLFKVRYSKSGHICTRLYFSSEIKVKTNFWWYY